MTTESRYILTSKYEKARSIWYKRKNQSLNRSNQSRTNHKIMLTFQSKLPAFWDQHPPMWHIAVSPSLLGRLLSPFLALARTLLDQWPRFDWTSPPKIPQSCFWSSASRHREQWFRLFERTGFSSTEQFYTVDIALFLVLLSGLNMWGCASTLWVSCWQGLRMRFRRLGRHHLRLETGEAIWEQFVYMLSVVLCVTIWWLVGVRLRAMGVILCLWLHLRFLKEYRRLLREASFHSKESISASFLQRLLPMNSRILLLKRRPSF